MAERSSDGKTTCCRGPLWTQLIGSFEVPLVIAHSGRHTPLVKLSRFLRSALIYSGVDSLLRRRKGG